MATYTVYPHVALDPSSGELVETATGTIHTLDDVSGTSPLPVTDLAGVPYAGNLVPVSRGVTAAFRVEDHPVVAWHTGGSVVIPMWSPTQVAEAATAAADAAQAAASAVTQRAVPAGGTLGQVLRKASDNPYDTEWGTAPSGGGGGVADHGDLTGLDGDDHPHYLNQTRGDARYPTRAEFTAAVAARVVVVGHGDPTPTEPTGTVVIRLDA